MPARRTYDTQDEQLIAQLSRRGMNSNEIRQELARMNRNVGRKVIDRIRRRAGSSNDQRASEQQCTAEQAYFDADPEDVELRKWIARARQEDRVEEAAKLMRMLLAHRDNRHRCAPVEAVKPEEHPDMIAAAERARRKLCDYVERARAGKLRGRVGARPSDGLSVRRTTALTQQAQSTR